MGGWLNKVGRAVRKLDDGELEAQLAELRNSLIPLNALNSEISNTGFKVIDDIITEVYNEGLNDSKYGDDEWKRDEGRFVMIAVDRIRDKIQEKLNKREKDLLQHKALTAEKMNRLENRNKSKEQ